MRARAATASKVTSDPEIQRQRRQARTVVATKEKRATQTAAWQFAARCPYPTDLCFGRRPLLERTPNGALVACHWWRELDLVAFDPSAAVGTGRSREERRLMMVCTHTTRAQREHQGNGEVRRYDRGRGPPRICRPPGWSSEPRAPWVRVRQREGDACRDIDEA
jgi:hypothetical protein